MDLERLELSQVGTVSHRHTMRLVAGKPGGKQRVVVGDDLGCVACLELKRGEAVVVFKQTLGGEGVTAVATGSGGGAKGDRIFVAQGQTIVGLQRKGKQFFKMESSLVEPICHVSVDEHHLFTGCEYVYTKYDNGKDDAFYMCHDRIGAMAVGPRLSGGPHLVLLGCRDHVVRVVRGSDLVFQQRFEDSPVTALKVFPSAMTDDDDDDDERRREPCFDVAFGAESGRVGAMRVFEDRARVSWAIDDDGGRSRATCVDVARFFQGDGVDIVCGRADGRVQVVHRAAGVANVVFQASLSEAIQSLECGSVVAAATTDIVCCTFAGTLVAFSPEHHHSSSSPRPTTEHSFSLTAPLSPRADDSPRETTENKIARLQHDVDRLEVEVETARRRAASQSPTVPRLEPRAEMRLDPENACYVITLELPVPIELVVFKSSVRVELVECSTALVSRPRPERRHETSKQPVAFVCVFRCQDEANALSFKLRTVEGEPGTATAMVVARGTPGTKSAQVARFDVKALSLHRRVRATRADDRPTNRLAFQGDFSAQMFHDWLGACLPEVPPRPQPYEEGEEKDDDAEQALDYRMCFRNVYTAGTLECDYADGEARVRSDSLSAIAILKEHVSKEAVRLRVSVRDTVTVDDATIPHFLKLIDHKLKAQVDLARRAMLLDAVNEIYTSEEDPDQWISEEYAYIHANAANIRKDLDNSETALDYLVGIVTDFFVDRLKFAGIDARHKIPQLEALVRKHDFDSTLAFFDPSLHRS
ncbi:hypothetical protein CTAYLR_006958 [Chrysophaeum taylorii]|uniref:Bardet-Biedl syndrome 7 protein n=1 Tax=Chrysophaeum taylorii TaxID=2483200 RepID=A0AAD7UDQ7_9STRA|nr:hypothetical protein CTAYLR_006958 [Chrysophaeum taylorii]